MKPKAAPTEIALPARALCASIVLAASGLAACGSSDDPPTSAGQQLAPQVGTQATLSAFQVLGVAPGPTPFISLVELSGAEVENLTNIQFTIAPRPGSVSKPVHVTYGMGMLLSEGRVSAEQGQITLPVFGLYAGYSNQVSIQLDFQDGSTTQIPLGITTAAYADPTAIYDKPTVLMQRAAGSALGFDFFVMKAAVGSPVIVDTDGELRWAGTGVASGMSSALNGDVFLIGDQQSPTLHRLGLDGVLRADIALPDPPYADFDHNIDYGKQGFLANFDTVDTLPRRLAGIKNIETTLVEMNSQSHIFSKWDMAEILSNYMRSQGDDPSAFVRPGVDWFHMNASAYDPNDDTVIVSSRENFLIKLDYATGNIVWIFGDPTKYWYTFPSLRAKAVSLAPDGLYPIGQHAVSVTPDGLVMVFNDGYPSVNEPPGEPAGASRTYSAVSAYSIDPGALTAQEVWRFEYNQSILSDFCGSAYQTTDGSVLVDYALAENGTEARLVGLDAGHNVVFDLRYPTTSCNTSWNAVPIALDAYTIP